MSDFDLRKLLKGQVIDPIVTVMAEKDKRLEGLIAGLGTWCGSADKLADAPTVDLAGKAVSNGDTFTLTTTDGDNPAGLYRYANGAWVLEINYDALDIASIIANAKAKGDGIDPTKTVNPATGDVTTNDNSSFVTPKQLADILNASQNGQEEELKNVYHPKGGDANLKVVGKDAGAGTQEFVTAKQLEATFTQAEVQAIYDAI